MNLIESLLCRTIGCSSIFAHWFGWPYLRVCHPFVMWRHKE